jgi:hypothetical protein
MKNIFLAIVIHVIVPLIGLLFFLRKKIKEERELPILNCRVLFFCLQPWRTSNSCDYHTFLAMVRFSLSWSLYLVLIAPFIMIFLAYRMKNNKIQFIMN